MQLINQLPQPTWHHLGVNEADSRIPAVSWKEALSAPTITFSLPESTCVPDAQFTEGGLGSVWERELFHTASPHTYVLDNASGNPLEIHVTLSDEGLTPMALDLHGLSGSETTIYEIVEGKGEYAGLTRMVADKHAKVHLVQVHMPDMQSRIWSSVAVSLAEEAEVSVTRIELGATSIVAGVRSTLNHPRSVFNMGALYLGRGHDLLDFNDVADHIAPDTHSEMRTVGVLDDMASKILRGTIDFKRGSVHAVGYESEDVLVFGEKVRNRTAPLILCAEERVEGQHAASIGRINEDELYYCKARGMSEAQARELLAFAKLRPVLDRIPDANLHDRLLTAIEERLKNHA